MIVKLVCGSLMLMSIAVRAAFTAGAVAGTAGTVGLYALRRAMKERGCEPKTCSRRDSSAEVDHV